MFLNGPIPASFCLFSSFLISISIIQIEKSLDGVLWIRTHCRRLVGADKTTELWQPAKIRERSLVRLTLSLLISDLKDVLIATIHKILTQTSWA